jgi:hypothetical protein
MANATVGAKAGTLDLEIEQGATFSTTITWQAGETPAPVNLTGYTAGTITLRITDEQTALITAEGGKWDLELEDATGDVRRLLRGNWKLVREVTY